MRGLRASPQALLAVLVTLLLVACSRTGLELLPPPPQAPVDDRLRIQAQTCTSPVEDLVFPIRVLFLIDASDSLDITDPPDPITGRTSRELAVEAAAEELLTGDRDAKISIVRFSADARNLTTETDEDGNFAGYFTDDLDLVRANLPNVSDTERTTNLVGALGEAYTEVRDELERFPQSSLALTTVHVILVTDGLPDGEGGGTRAIRESVDSIVELGSLFRVDRLSVSTALLDPGSGPVRAQAEALLEDLAERGDGTYRAFANGAELDFLFVDITSLTRLFTLKTFSAWNLNAITDRDRVLADSDADGLPDVRELELGTDPLLPDTDGDGCRDLIEGTLVGSLDPSDPTDCDCFLADPCIDREPADGLCDNGCTDADEDGLCDCPDVDGDGRCDPSTYADFDGDGLVDCEERWAGTNPRAADSDGDGLLDTHELRFGTAPDVDDLEDDLDWDAVPDLEEVRTGTDPNHVSAQGRYEQAYRYSLVEHPRTEGVACYDLDVQRITLTENLDPTTRDDEVDVGAWPLGQGATGANRVLMVVGEVPFDDQDRFPRYRVGCVQADFVREGSYRDPPSGRMRLSRDDFVDLDAFDADVHCRLPGEAAMTLETQ